MLFFSPFNILQVFFFSVDGVEKVGIPLLLLALLAAVLFNSNRGLILAFVRFNSIADHCNAASTVRVGRVFNLSYLHW